MCRLFSFLASSKKIVFILSAFQLWQIIRRYESTSSKKKSNEPIGISNEKEKSGATWKAKKEKKPEQFYTICKLSEYQEKRCQRNKWNEHAHILILQCFLFLSFSFSALHICSFFLFFFFSVESLCAFCDCLISYIIPSSINIMHSYIYIVKPNKRRTFVYLYLCESNFVLNYTK